MAGYFTRRESILEDAGLSKIQASDEVFYELIKPFNERKPYPFINEKWLVVELLNDFFIEKHNFTILSKLSALNHEDHCLITYAYPFNPAIYYKLQLTTDINQLRQLMNDDSDKYVDWSFLSPSKTWAALSFYDEDALFIGCQQNFRASLEETIRDNPDFVKFL
jgi:hypothetical protein